MTEDDIWSREEILRENQYYCLVSEPDSLEPVIAERQPKTAVSRLLELCQADPGGPQPSYQDFPAPTGSFSIQCSLGCLRTEGWGSNKESFNYILRRNIYLVLFRNWPSEMLRPR